MCEIIHREKLSKTGCAKIALKETNVPFLGISSEAKGVNVMPLVPPLRAIHLSSPNTSYVRGLTYAVGSGAGIAV